MKNVRLTLVTALSVLALTFAGVASADNNRSNNYKQQKEVSYSKNAKKSKTTNVYNNTKNVKKVVVKSPVIKKAPTKKVVVTKNSKKIAPKVVVKKVVKPSSYQVRSGDTLYHISLKVGVSVNQLVKLNHLSKSNINNIRIGQILRIL